MVRWLRIRVRAYASRASCARVCACARTRLRAMMVDVCRSRCARVADVECASCSASSRAAAERLGVCKECKVRAVVVARIRADRALQHGRWEEMMCNNARATHSARTEHDGFRWSGRRRAETRALATNRYLEGARRSARICRAANGLCSRSSSVLEKIAALFPVSSARPERGRPFEGDQDAIRFLDASLKVAVNGSRGRSYSPIFSLSRSEATITDIRNSIGI